MSAVITHIGQNNSMTLKRKRPLAPQRFFFRQGGWIGDRKGARSNNIPGIKESITSAQKTKPKGIYAFSWHQLSIVKKKIA